MNSAFLGGPRFARSLSVAAMAVAVHSAAAFGQFGGTKEPMVRVGFGGGVTVPVADAGDAFKSGVNGSGFVLLNLFGGGLPALRFAFTYDKFDYKPSVAGAGIGSTSTIDPGSSRIIGGTGGLKIHLIPGPISPYVLAGVGAFDVRDLINQTSGAQQTLTNLNFGVDGGAGLELKLGRLSAFAEGRLQNVFTRNGGFLKTSSIQSVPVTFGVLF